jgi:hypothetical protein
VGGRHADAEMFFFQVTANVMRPHATMVALAMMKGMHLSVYVLEAGKERPVT